jgi:ethanolamine utilization protein EutQ (cupin superfamily)
MEFTETGISEPWTLRYEETIYVIVGHIDIEIIIEGRAPTNIAGDPGDLLVLPEGTTVRYGGTEGTRLLLSITPVDWRDHL